MIRNNAGQANRLLGCPPDARLLIINADDFGMCHAVNRAVAQALAIGMATSATLMAPCPWAAHAMRFLREHPEIPFGIHLTAISDWADYPWGPVLPRSAVPTLVTESGWFYNFDGMPCMLAQANLGELEREFRAQIEIVLGAGLQPTHLDWHSLRIDNRPDIMELMFGLAKAYGLALRVRGAVMIAKIQAQGYPTNDRDFLDSYGLDPKTKAAAYVRLLRELPEGLTEWAVHPGLDCPELLAIEGEENHIRQSDLDFLISAEARQVIEAEGIILLDYRPLQVVWRE